MSEASANIPMSPVALPAPRVPIAVRPATLDDLPFIDALQKRHTRMVGWMPTKQLEQKIAAGHVLVAEGAGYCIGRDQYFKRDDVGIIYQVNVMPGRQRGLVGAALVRAVFERAAYGCKLFCCWCAQDIEANWFWESLGFVPLAFRAGSREKGRVHIFWQRRIRAGDTTTPYWFPSQTGSGSIREDRIVLPIPPGTHWRDAKPIVLPESKDEGGTKALPGKGRRTLPAELKTPRSTIAAGGLRFAPVEAAKPVGEAKAKRAARAKVKNDPRLVAAARELRDRWLEHVNAHPEALLERGKYQIGLTVETAGDASPSPRLTMTRPLTPLPAPAAAA